MEAISVFTTVIRLMNQLAANVPDDMRNKTCYLQVTIVNTSKRQRVEVKDTWFDCGRFWSQPFGSIGSGETRTFYVCNKDMVMFVGVPGGIGLRVYDGDSSAHFAVDGADWWICTFSSPYAASNKCLTRWKDFDIKPLWDHMEAPHRITDPRCGCYQKDNNHMVSSGRTP